MVSVIGGVPLYTVICSTTLIAAITLPTPVFDYLRREGGGRREGGRREGGRGELSDLSGRQTVCFPLWILFCNSQENLFAMLQDKNPNRKPGFEATEGKHLRLSVCLRTGVFGTSCRYNLSLEPSSCINIEQSYNTLHTTASHSQSTDDICSSSSCWPVTGPLLAIPTPLYCLFPRL